MRGSVKISVSLLSSTSGRSSKLTFVNLHSKNASQQRPNGYSVRDLEKVRKAVDYDIDRVNQKILSEAYSDIEAAVDEAKEISECESKQSEEEPENQTQEADELKHVPDNPSGEDLDWFKGQLEDAGDMEKVRTIADSSDMDEAAISKKCYEIDKNGGDYQQALEDELEKQEREIERNERVESYAFEKTPFDRGLSG